MDTKEIIERADTLYERAETACELGVYNDKTYGTQAWCEKFTVKELWFLWGLCCNVNGQAWDDEVYNALDSMDEFKH